MRTRHDPASADRPGDADRRIGIRAPPDRAFFEKAIEFLRSFADRSHHGKEEDILFRMMVEDLDYPRNGGPVAVLTKEHEKGRDLIRRLADATAVLERDPTATPRVIENGRGYIQLLRIHIEREDSVVFPMVEQFLDDADQARLATDFEQFDRHEIASGSREASLRLLEDLSQHARGLQREPDPHRVSGPRS